MVVNSAVGVAQELRADRAVTALSQLNAPAVRVRRDGSESRIPASDLVPGDVVFLGEGDVVPADGAVLEASALLVDESALTGESVPIGKRGPQAEEAGDALGAGTVVVKGRALIEVSRTGQASTLGRIASLMDVRPQPTPLQRRLAGLGRVLAAVAVALSGVVLVLGLLRGQPAETMVVMAIALAVAAVPESLPAVVTLSLALGASRMAERNAIVRRLPAVETLGSVTILATDKTGTLTQGRMMVQEAWTPQRSVTFGGEGYEPTGRVLEGDLPLAPDAAPDVVELLAAAALCNDAGLVPPADADGRWSGLGDPTEVALLAAAGKAGTASRRARADLSARRRGAVRQRHPVDDDRAPGRIAFARRQEGFAGEGSRLLRRSGRTWDRGGGHPSGRRARRARVPGARGRVRSGRRHCDGTAGPGYRVAHPRARGDRGRAQAGRPGHRRGVPVGRHHPRVDHRRPPGHGAGGRRRGRCGRRTGRRGRDRRGDPVEDRFRISPSPACSRERRPSRSSTSSKRGETAARWSR